jgi:hypothetical protein
MEIRKDKIKGVAISGYMQAISEKISKIIMRFH